MTTQYKTMQTKKNYTIHQLERELAQTTKQLSKRERGRYLSLIIMERERVFKSVKQYTYISKCIHILSQTFVIHNIEYKTDFVQTVAYTCTL